MLSVEVNAFSTEMSFLAETVTKLPVAAKVSAKLALPLRAVSATVLLSAANAPLTVMLAPANKVGVIDSDYRGEICVVLHNHGKEIQTIDHGDRIAQLVITPVLQPAYAMAEELQETERSGGGFGSTGK